MKSSSSHKPLTPVSEAALAIIQAQPGIRGPQLWAHPRFKAQRPGTRQAMGRALAILKRYGLIRRATPQNEKSGWEPINPGGAVETAEEAAAVARAQVPVLLPQTRGSRTTAISQRGQTTEPIASREMAVEVKVGSEFTLTIGDMRLTVKAVTQ